MAAIGAIIGVGAVLAVVSFGVPLGTPPVVGNGASATARIGPEGGNLEYQAVRLEIPAGALHTTYTIRVTSTTTAAPGRFDNFTPVYEFEPHGLKFAKPAKVSFALGAETKDGKNAMVYWSNAARGEFAALPTTRADGRAGTQIEHFSTGFAGQHVPCQPGDCGDGCCDTKSGKCMHGDQDATCGPDGGECKRCGDGTVCVVNACKKPDLEKCTHGCRAADGSCVRGNEANACGTGGNACSSCDDGQLPCLRQTCEPCSEKTCSTCCSSATDCDGRPRRDPGGRDTLCGSGGDACQNCQESGQMCAPEGECVK